MLEQDPVLCNRFKSALVLSGYHVKVTDRATEAFALFDSFARSEHPFDLVIVDLSDGRYRGFIADVLRAHAGQPIFTLKDAIDKSLIIDLLNQGQHTFIDRFLESSVQNPGMTIKK